MMKDSYCKVSIFTQLIIITNVLRLTYSIAAGFNRRKTVDYSFKYIFLSYTILKMNHFLTLESTRFLICF